MKDGKTNIKKITIRYNAYVFKKRFMIEKIIKYKINKLDPRTNENLDWIFITNIDVRIKRIKLTTEVLL